MVKRFLAVFILFFASFAAFAQPTDLDSFEYLGIRHFIRYSPLTAAESLNFQNAIETALDVLDPLWEGAERPTIVLDLAPMPALDADGNPLVGGLTQRIKSIILPFTLPEPPENVCYIEFYTLPSAIERAFAVAQQVAHCYQWYNVPALEATTGATMPLALHAWWYEGAALWMAALVDDSIAIELWDKVQADFIAQRENTLVKGALDAYYFWKYAADALGVEQIIALQVFMPSDVNEHPAYLAEKLGDADRFMHDFALKVAGGDLPHLPAADDLFARYPINSLPFTAVIRSEPLGVGWTQLSVNVDLDADEGIELEVLTIDSSGLTISLDDGTVLLKNEPVKLCTPAPKPRVIFSRALAGADIDPPEEAQILISRVDCEPSSSPTPEDVSTCIIGSWTLIEQPELSGSAMSFTGIQRITVAEDGSTITDYIDFVMQTQIEGVGPAQMTFNGSATGKISVDADGFVVDGGEIAMNVIAIISVAGTTVTMPLNDLGEFAAGVGIQSGTQITCNRQRLELTVPVTGISGSFVFERDGSEDEDTGEEE